jgi:hypothetical protein
VIAAQDFTAEGKYSVTRTGKIDRNQSTSLFVRVPDNASALTVDMAAGGAAGKGQVRFLRFDPYGLPGDVTSSTNCYNPDAGAGCAGGTATNRTVTNPVPGVWEIVVEARRTSDVDSAPYSVTASVFGTAINPNPDTIASAVAGQPLARNYSVSNSLAAFNGHVVGSTLGSAKTDRPSITEGVKQQYSVTVAPGASALTATIGNPSDVSADLDLVVYNCTSGTCVVAGSSADGDSEESVTIANPAAGRWVVLVDGYSVPAGTTQYDYIDIYTAASLGSVDVTDGNADHAAGTTWTVAGTVTPKGQPGAGRVLRGDLTVLRSDDVAVGRGAVIVQSVS